MYYFNGFSFCDEQILFKDFIDNSEYCVAGFSYGAINAFRFVLDNCDMRVDKLQLFSPAFFNNKDKKFTRLQLLHYKKDPSSYTNNFIKNILYPNNYDITKYISNGDYQQLEDLLTFRWKDSDMLELKKRDISLEVFLGEDDKIVDSIDSKEFFIEYATVYMIKNVGHILK
jgi:hypothetical protein